MTAPSDDRLEVIVTSLAELPLNEGALFKFVEQGIRTLPARYPGLKVVRHEVRKGEVEMLLDLRRLDEDTQRIVASFKSEVGNLARKEGLVEGPFWRWGYEER
jgi:hypothetical protein